MPKNNNITEKKIIPLSSQISKHLTRIGKKYAQEKDDRVLGDLRSAMILLSSALTLAAAGTDSESDVRKLFEAGKLVSKKRR